VDHEVIGIASDVRNAGLAVPAEPEYYVVRRHDDNAPLRHSTLIVRSSSGFVAAPGTIRREIAAMDPTIPIEVLPMDESISELASRPRLLALVLALFAATAASLAAIGMAGVSAYQVVQRRREIGIRLTLGATPQQARSVVLWRVLPPVVIGLVSGCMLSAWSVRLAEPLLHKVSPQVWITASALLMAAVAAVAAWIPACAAARVDPQATLRAE
jgi:ABC-type lipoprotein release transport system permease subunit